MKKRYLILIGGFLFVWGIGIGRYQWPPFQIIKSIQDITNTCQGENYYSEGCTERVKIKKDYLGSDQIDFAISEIKQIDSNPLNSRKELIKKTIVPIELI